ncbi:MAG: VOC family protein [Bauldia sp.]
MAHLHEIVVDCEHPAKLARFWATVLEGYAVRPHDDAEIARLSALGLTPETDPTVMVDGPGPKLCFQRVPGRRYDNNRMHIDISAADRQAEVRRLLALGATLARETEGYTVMRDPEGNQFCVVATG